MTVLETTTPALPVPGPPAGPADAAVDADEPALRTLRASLLEEALRLRRWQRLVQARLDLATDRLSPAEALGEQEHEHDPLGHVGAPGSCGPADLVALVRGQVDDVTDAADDLRAVVTTHRALRARAVILAGRLAAVDGALAGRGTARRCCPRG